MKNKELAAVLDSFADVLEIKGESPFRVNAYRRAARTIDDLAADIERIAEEDGLQKIQGVGKGLASSIEEFLATGTIRGYEDEKKTIPRKLLELLSVPGLGPKTIGLLWKELDVRSLSSLKRALRGKKVLDLPGIGPKKVENIQSGIRAYESRSGRLTLGAVLPIAESLLERMAGVEGVGRVDVAGSLRRSRETIGDIDILVTSRKAKAAIDAFTSAPGVNEVLAAGRTKASVRIEDAVQVDLRVVPEASYGAALLYFTGSKDHNVRMRGIAQSRGMKLNEYGLFKNDRRLAGKTEEAIFKRLGMAYIPPELREDRGEVEAALDGELPELVELGDIRGDLHCHSDYSDGVSTIEEMAQAAKASGYSYISMNDHSRSLGIAHGLTVERLERQMGEIDEVNARLRGVTVLKGTEVDILSDGSLDYPDDLLERLDIVVASVHSGFQQSRDKITGRILSAIRNPHVDIIGHPTGRLLGSRSAYDVDLDAVMEAAAETGTALELNAHYERLDLNDQNCRRAAELGVMIAISTDSHAEDQLWTMGLGVKTARRGWLGPENVLNTLSKSKLLRYLSNKPS